MTNHGEVVAVLVPPGRNPSPMLQTRPRRRPRWFRRSCSAPHHRDGPGRPGRPARGPVILYIDTSAAAKLLVEEDASARLATHLDVAVAADDTVVSSMLLETELRRLAVRFDLAQSAVTQLLDRVDLVEHFGPDPLPRRKVCFPAHTCAASTPCTSPPLCGSARTSCSPLRQTPGRCRRRRRPPRPRALIGIERAIQYRAVRAPAAGDWRRVSRRRTRRGRPRCHADVRKISSSPANRDGHEQPSENNTCRARGYFSEF